MKIRIRGVAIVRDRPVFVEWDGAVVEEGSLSSGRVKMAIELKTRALDDEIAADALALIDRATKKPRRPRQPRAPGGN